MTSTSAAALAGRIARLERASRDRSAQLAYSAIEDGAITSLDMYDTATGSYGRQFDGSDMAMSLRGVTPLTPAGHSVAANPAQVKIRWAGLWVESAVLPSDFARVEVHASAVPGFAADTAATLRATFETPRGGEVDITLPPGSPYYFRLVARNLAGGRGPASAEISATPGAVVSAAEFAAAQTKIDDALLKAGDAKAITDGWRVTGKTTIDGGKIEADSLTALAIKANTIGAKHLVVADTSNMAEVNETVPGVASFEGVTTLIETVNGVTWSKRDLPANSSYFMFRSKSGPLPFKSGQRIRLTFEAYAEAATAFTARVWTYGTVSPSSALNPVTGSPTSLTTAPQTFTLEGLAPDVTDQTSFLIGLNGLTGAVVRVRNIQARVMNAGELLVDGSIFAKHLTTDSVLANSIKSGEITAGKLAAGSVIAGNLAANAVQAGNISAGAITTDKLDANAINGMTITGVTVRTAATGRRIAFENAGLTAYRDNGSVNFRIHSETDPDIADGPAYGATLGVNSAMRFEIGVDGAFVMKDGANRKLLIRSTGSALSGSAIDMFTNNSPGADGDGDAYSGSIRVYGDQASTTTKFLRNQDVVLGGGLRSTRMRDTYGEWAGAANSSSTSWSYIPTNEVLAFVAPPSGQVAVMMSAYLRSGTDLGAYAQAGFRVITGSVLGLGSVVYEPTDVIANSNVGWVQCGGFRQLYGLTPGATYHLRGMYRSNNGANPVYVSGCSLLVIPSA